MTEDVPMMTDPALRPLAERVIAGESLGYDDGVALYRSRDLHGIGRLANFVRERLHGDRTYYNRNRHINYTNVCALSCKFCSFYRKRGEEGAYEMPVEQVVATAVQGRRRRRDRSPHRRRAAPVAEVRLLPRHAPRHPRRLPRAAHQGLHRHRDHPLQPHRAHEHPRSAGRPARAGLGSLPGGGAEIFDDRVHDEVFKGKVRADKWFEVHRTAHASASTPTPRCSTATSRRPRSGSAI